MAFFQGVDFRNTAGYVTDPTNYTSDTGGGSTYPTVLSPSGINGGWEQAPTGDLDRSQALATARLAGLAYVSAGPSNYRMDLPATGTNYIQAAFGDANSSQVQFTVKFKDTNSVFATPVNNSGFGTANEYISANGTTESGDTAWNTANPNAGSGTDEISNSFSTTIFRIEMTGGSSSAVMNSIMVRNPSAGGDVLQAQACL